MSLYLMSKRYKLSIWQFILASERQIPLVYNDISIGFLWCSVNNSSERAPHLSVWICSERKALHQITFSSGFCFLQIHSESADSESGELLHFLLDGLGVLLPYYAKCNRQTLNIPVRAKCDVSDLCVSFISNRVCCIQRTPGSNKLLLTQTLIKP